MSDPAESVTNRTLLGRLRSNPTQESAWSEFVNRYGAKIFQWCRHWGLQEADAADVSQTVLLDLARQMREFTYDPSGSFRAWLKTITYRAWCKWREQRQRPGTGSGDSAVAALLAETPSGEDLVQQMEAECNRELLEHAMALVRLRVRPQTWEAFRLLALENWSGKDTAAHLGLKISHVFVARCKVQKLIREEVEQLDRLDP
jgi:RNA polymerase sigma-70 factor (ECF subfamily)